MNRRSRNVKSVSRRWLALLLCCVCLLGLLPIRALATETDGTPTEEQTILTPETPVTETPATDTPTTDTPTTDTPVTDTPVTDAPAQQSLYEKLMACTTVAEVDALLICDTEEAQAAVDAEINAFTDDQIAAVDAHLLELGYYNLNTLANYSVTIAAGSSGTVSVNMQSLNNPTISPSTTGITGNYSNGTVTINVASTVSAGTYKVYVKQGNLIKHTITVTVTSSGSSSGGSTTIAPGNRYYHLDMRVSATVNVTVYNEDGTFTTTPVTATLSNPSATIYNTGSKTWSSSSGTDSTTNLKYWSIGFNNQTSSDSGAYEYMQNSPNRQATEFYNGDTAVLTYTLTYTLNGTTHTVPVETSYVFVEEDNQCSRKNNTDSQRGFDYVASVNDVTTAFSTSQLQISKAWNDNNNAERPDSITVRVYQAVNSSKKEYMTLNLNKDKNKSSFTMASGITQDSDMVVTFSDNYGVGIVGLPANHWVNNNGSYTYESCSYTVEEVLITDANGTISPVYGSFVYVDDTKTNSYVIAITNTLAYEKLAVKKVWDDSESVEHTNDSVTVKLTAWYSLDNVKTQVPDEWLANFIGGNTEVTLSNANNWYKVLGYMPVYYTVGGTNYLITAFEIAETDITVDNGETYTATCSGISTSKDANGNYYFTVTNTPKPAAYTLTVKKTLSGNMYNANDKFDFTVTYGDETETFQLGNNESHTFSVPVGAAVKVTEKPGDYTYQFVSITDGVTKTDLTYEKGITFTMPEKDVEVVINNDNEVTISTGILLDTLPYILILAIVAAGAVLLLRKKRNRED